MLIRVLPALLFSIANCGAAIASPLAPGHLPVAASDAEQSALQARFAKAQRIVRAGLQPFDLRLVDGEMSFLAQHNDGFVRLPKNLVAIVGDPAALNALMLIGLSYATHRQPEAPQLSKTAKILTGVAGFVGRNAAESWERRYGTKATDLLAQPTVNNPDRLEDPQNPMLRGMIWAKTNGGCEAGIVAALRSLSNQHRDETLRQDALTMLRALGSTAWVPDDRCGA